ncbi:hypothetical protein [Ottowia sp.]|uniref:hypothetical protein n=1 Tax=Ottowia sp. TaxID=1898956 RepID=UPI002C633380|nr:hypothetical protein [Ottowia sp.]HOB66198.1 hypothetical protein [Ottowia sp.]HPZ58243.1 hypothetical protein [Ottowia sp.]HQD48593.1 hypothetical protein [Ottowia sp.]
MGTNVIQLADWAVPSYRRPRGSTPQTAAGTWADLARHRVAQRHATEQASAQRSLLLVPAAAACAANASVPAGKAPATVRVTRPVDARHAPEASGRLRISGRLIDVCAELERLAAAEAQAAVSRCA